MLNLVFRHATICWTIVWMIGSPVVAGTFEAATASIKADQIRKHCEVLASDTFEGRESGSRGGQAAGAYIVQALRKLPVRGGGREGDFYLPFPPHGQNILVILPGSDPQLKHEYVLVGAHYDHVGFGNARNSRGPIGVIHNGADDNASGIAGLLEVIEACCALDAAPKRSLAFAFWDGEEAGLLGSENYVAAPTIPLAQIKLVLNIDMIGRLRENRAEVFGVRTAAGLREFLALNNQQSPIALSFTWQNKRESDHYPFFAHQVPYLMVYTGKHDDYHTPRDDVDKLNNSGAAALAQLFFRLAHAAADGPPLPAFRMSSFYEGAYEQQAAETPSIPPPARLGVTWNADLAKQGTIEISGIDPGSAAERSGLQPGDRLRTIDGLAIRGEGDIRDAIAHAGGRAVFNVERGKAKVRALTVSLDGSPQPLGVAWKFDAAEPRTAILTQVTPGAAGHRAGLRALDRVDRVAGEPFADDAAFRGLLRAQRQPFALRVEREGIMRTLVVPWPRPAGG